MVQSEEDYKQDLGVKRLTRKQPLWKKLLKPLYTVTLTDYSTT